MTNQFADEEIKRERALELLKEEIRIVIVNCKN